jgi:uncharacterized protein (TIGR02147 family)
MKMRNPKQIYSEILLREFESRRKRNRAYSLRAFANFLGVASGTLSSILRGQRPIPLKMAHNFVSKLKLDSAQEQVFLESANATSDMRKLLRVKPPKRSDLLLDEDRAILLTEWEHFAVLALLETEAHFVSVEEIGKRLQVSQSRTRQVLNTLSDFGFVDQVRKNKFSLTKFGKERGATIADLASLQTANRRSLELALQKISYSGEDISYFDSATIAVSKFRILEAQELIIEFRKRLCALLEMGERDEVYMFNVQLFPLSRPEKRS